jgi:hypothetical protein
MQDVRGVPPVLVPADAPELRLVHEWLDNWSGIGLIIAGMTHQGFTVSLGEHGVGRWIAVFYHGRGGHEPVAAAGTAQEPTPLRAVQRAGRAAVNARLLRSLPPQPVAGPDHDHRPRDRAHTQHHAEVPVAGEAIPAGDDEGE